MTILGIDGSLRSTGWAVIDLDFKLIDMGVFPTKKTNDEIIDETIYAITRHLAEQVDHYDVKAAGIEDGFVGINKQTSLVLSRVRQGIVTGLQIHRPMQMVYLQPSKVRSLLMHKGSATKEEVANYIRFIYRNDPRIEALGPLNDGKGKSKNSDIYDAIASALATACQLNPKFSLK